MVTYGYILYIIYGFTLLDMFFMVTYIYIYIHLDWNCTSK